MDRKTWQREWKKAWDDYQRAYQEWDSAMPSTQSKLPIQFESIDMERVGRLKTDVDKAWSRVVELHGNRPSA